MIHGDQSLASPWCRIYQTIDGQNVEVFETPFYSETRALANECIDRFERMTRRRLTWDTPNADREARGLIRTGFPAAIRDAERRGNEALARHLRDLWAECPAERAYEWLNILAIEGAGRRPAAPVMVRKIVPAIPAGQSGRA